jgi:hypothetical protein
MLRAMIVKITNSTREIEKEMPTRRRSKRFQPLSDSENLNEELVNDEQKKEIRKNHNAQDDKYLQGVFSQKCHNEGHLTKECKLMQTICSIYQRQGHETNDYPLNELGG